MAEISGKYREQRIPEADRAKRPTPIRNDRLKADMEKLRTAPDQELYVKVLNEVVDAQLLVPIQMDRDPEVDQDSGEVVIDKDTQIRFEIIENKQGELYYPVFTDGSEMKKLSLEEDQRSLIVSFMDLAAMVDMQPGQMAGFVIDPKGGNMVFPADMIRKMTDEIQRNTNERKNKDAEESGENI